MKLSAELIEQAPQFLNTLHDREIDLRGRFSSVDSDNQDQFDTVDLSDNDIVNVEGFPHLLRLKNLLINNNKVTKVSLSHRLVIKIDPNLHELLPNITELILTNNNLQNFSDLSELYNFKKLSSLSLLRNPVTFKPHYRAFVIYKIPQITLLDFQKVKYQERLEAKKIFGGTSGRKLKESLDSVSKQDNKIAKQSKELQMNRIKKAILKAKSLREVRRLETLLQMGQIPNEDSNEEEK